MEFTKVIRNLTWNLIEFLPNLFHLMDLPPTPHPPPPPSHTVRTLFLTDHLWFKIDVKVLRISQKFVNQHILMEDFRF
jgi:hypothetical protein